MNSRRRFAIGAIAGIAALAGGAALRRYLTPASPVHAAAVDRLMALRLPDLDGKERAIAQWRGQVIVANFWATWCTPCREEMPGFERLHKRYADSGVRFVGVSIDSPEKVRQFAAQAGISYPLLVGDAGVLDLIRDLGNPSQGLPFTVVLDRKGTPRRVRVGLFREQELAGLLTAIGNG